MSLNDCLVSGKKREGTRSPGPDSTAFTAAVRRGCFRVWIARSVEYFPLSTLPSPYAVFKGQSKVQIRHEHCKSVSVVHTHQLLMHSVIILCTIQSTGGCIVETKHKRTGRNRGVLNQWEPPNVLRTILLRSRSLCSVRHLCSTRMTPSHFVRSPSSKLSEWNIRSGSRLTKALVLRNLWALTRCTVPLTGSAHIFLGERTTPSRKQVSDIVIVMLKTIRDIERATWWYSNWNLTQRSA
jgi:hypothetical protein